MIPAWGHAPLPSANENVRAIFFRAVIVVRCRRRHRSTECPGLVFAVNECGASTRRHDDRRRRQMRPVRGPVDEWVTPEIADEHGYIRAGKVWRMMCRRARGPRALGARRYRFDRWDGAAEAIRRERCHEGSVRSLPAAWRLGCDAHGARTTRRLHSVALHDVRALDDEGSASVPSFSGNSATGPVPKGLRSEFPRRLLSVSARLDARMRQAENRLFIRRC